MPQGLDWLLKIALVPVGTMAVTIVIFVALGYAFSWYSRARLRKPGTHTGLPR